MDESRAARPAFSLRAVRTNGLRSVWHQRQMNEAILVTGGAGYVGSHVVVELAQAGYAPVVLDDYSNSTPAVRTRLEALAGRPVPCINADVRDVVALRAAFHDHPIAGVVHCAGLKAVSEVGGASARVLRRQRRRHARARRGDGRGRRRDARVHVVGGRLRPAASALPVAEDAPLAPQRSTAARARRRGLPARPRACERQLADRDPARLQRRRRALVRACSARRRAAGPATSSRARRAAAGEVGDVPLYGNDWPTADGTAVRDYVHVQDLAQMHVAALQRLATQHGVDDAERRPRPRTFGARRRRRVRAACGRHGSRGRSRRGGRATSRAVIADPARAATFSNGTRRATSTRSVPTPGAGSGTAGATRAPCERRYANRRVPGPGRSSVMAARDRSVTRTGCDRECTTGVEATMTPGRARRSVDLLAEIDAASSAGRLVRSQAAELVGDHCGSASTYSDPRRDDRRLVADELGRDRLSCRR